MFLNTLAPICRIIGLIALFWTNWLIALVGFLSIGFTNRDDFSGKAIIKNTKIRIAVELITTILAIVGVWFFPLIKPTLAHITAVIFAVLSFVSLIGIGPSTT